ncbi:MAG: hypothetical protein DMG79_04075 [Acidobacteria bacterium]|nr:MAG: hypothetical protein DMG79_04075 [Acidobacteriota bacterium]
MHSVKSVKIDLVCGPSAVMPEIRIQDGFQLENPGSRAHFCDNQLRLFAVTFVVINAVTVALILLFSFQVSAVAQESQRSEQNSNELARKILQNEIKAEADDHSHWSFQLEYESGEGKETDEVVETKDGDLKHPVLINGHPLSAKEEHEAEERIQTFVRDPARLRKSAHEQSEDLARSQRLFKMLPDALIFSFAEDHGDTVKLHFKPNTQFRPPTREARVFQAMEGDLWVNRKQSRLAGISAHITHEVKFGGGWLGHLDPGGHFEVQQEEVAPGYWEMTRLNVDMKGKVLFFKTISVQQKTYRANLHRIPDNLTLAQAADLLRKQVLVARTTAGKSN